MDIRERGSMQRILLIVMAAMLLVSCDRSGGASSCPPDGGNLLKDTDFSLEAADKRSKFWGQSQHAGEVSFTTSIVDGAVTIKRIGTQPWFAYRQILRSADLAGQRMVFSAELKLDLQPPKVAHGFGDGGWLTVAARSAGGKLLMRSEKDQKPHIGKTDWEAVQVIVDLPSGTERVDLTLLLQADGVMSVRNPFFGPLVRCDEP